MIVVCLFLAWPALAKEYDATVTTEGGSYLVPVEVEGGEVTDVLWPDGGDMTISGAQIEGIEALGFNSEGEDVQIELEGYSKE